MCLGLPMTVVESQGASAVVERRGERRRVGLMLVGEVPPGTKLLVHLDTAVRLLADDEAALLDQALDGLDAALEGKDVDAYFPDLAGREPPLPPHLRKGGT